MQQAIGFLKVYHLAQEAKNLVKVHHTLEKFKGNVEDLRNLLERLIKVCNPPNLTTF